MKNLNFFGGNIIPTKIYLSISYTHENLICTQIRKEKGDDMLNKLILKWSNDVLNMKAFSH
jgi:hypothetical protein